MKLATRTALMVSALFVVTFGALAYRSLLYFEDRFVSLAGQDQLTLLRAYASKLSSNLASAHTTLVSAAKIVDEKMLSDPAEVQEFLDNRTFLRASFSGGLYLVDRNGRVIARTAVGSPPSAPNLLPSELALAQQTYATGKPQVSKEFVGPDADRVPLIAMSAPVIGRDGQTLGVMQGSLSLAEKNYAGALADIKVGVRGYLYLSTRDRILLMHPDPQRILGLSAKPGQNVGLDRALEQGFEGTAETVNSVGLDMLATFVSVPGRDWVLAANFPMDEVREPFRQALRDMAGGAALAVLLLFIVVLVIVRRVMRPVRELTEHLDDLGKGVRRTIDLPHKGELGMMVRAFNQMVHALGLSEAARLEGERSVRELNAKLEQRVLERTQALEYANAELQQTLDTNVLMQGELARSEKLVALGKMVAGMAHELNTPIGNALLVATSLQAQTRKFGDLVRADALRRSSLGEYEASSLDATQLIERNLNQAAELIAHFKQVAVDQTAEHRREFDLGDTLREVLVTLEHLIRHRPVTLHLELPPGISMNSYPGPLGQIVTNFFTNALTHAFAPDASGELWVSCQAVGEDEASLVFRDTGNGIAAEHLGSIFDPFFTTRMGRGGSGLGLSIVHSIATGTLGGTVTVQSRPQEGTTFTVRFPRVAPQAHGEP